MMGQRSVFFEEWISSLREQYKYVVRNRDKVTLPSLTAVLHQVGFTDDELAQLRIEATMHLDDVGADYVADMTILDSAKAVQAHPAECSCPQCIPIDDSQHDDDGQPLVNDDPEAASWEGGHIFPAAQSDTGEADAETQKDEPLAFEDSLTDNAADEGDQGDEAELEEPAAEDDPDDPQQMSLF